MAIHVLVLLLLLSATFCLRSGLRPAQARPTAVSNSTTTHCPPRCTRLLSQKQNDNLPGARIFYLVVVHNNRTLHDAVHLLRAIRDPRNVIAIHVDHKARHLLADEASLLHQETRDCSCGSTIRMESVYDVKWGEWSMNLPTLWGMRLAVTEYKDEWDVFINLSGDSLPVYTTDSMASLLHEIPYNFVTSSSCETGLLPTNVYTFPSYWHKRAHYTHSDTLPDPSFEYMDPSDGSRQNQTLQIHFGSQWMILQHDFCSFLVQQLDNAQSLASQFRDYLVDAGFLMTDETFFSSLLMQVKAFQNSLPRFDEDGYLLWRNGSSSPITAVRYERMDEHVPSAFGYFPVNQRYNVPNGSAVEQPRPWGPYFLGVYDLSSVRESGALFLRKVSTEVDHNLVHLLPVNRSDQIPFISWPDHVEVSEKPDWERIKARLLAQKSQGSDRDNQNSERDSEDDDEEL